MFYFVIGSQDTHSWYIHFLVILYTFIQYSDCEHPVVADKEKITGDKSFRPLPASKRQT
jgi:hypothetical protein